MHDSTGGTLHGRLVVGSLQIEAKGWKLIQHAGLGLSRNVIQ